jgi:hypothetical protein
MLPNTSKTMREELDRKLCEKYPEIFADRRKPMTETAMCWGFEHGDGWYNILDRLCANIQHYIEWKNRDGDTVPQVVAEQVKEKFGTLRFYYRGGDDYIRGLVNMAEAVTEVTCEECGAPGKTRGVGWIYTACDAHTKPEHL